jgi:hypothetical protein
MKLVVALVAVSAVNAAALRALEATSPVEKVVGLLVNLKAKIEADGRSEQREYDKYACWCESALGRKANDIDEGKSKIEDLEQLIVKTRADLAGHNVATAQLKKLIAGNIESQREATEIRTKEHSDYDKEKAESENCIGALEAAIKVLSRAGTSKTGFLGTLQEAQILGAVAGIKDVLRRPLVTHRFSEEEIHAVETFAEKPDDYIGGRSFGFSAAQVANNPFGDYAPQSTQIQGILKGMYDSFTADLERDNAEEAGKQKAFEQLIAIKKQELQTLEATLEKQELDAAEATKTLADSKEESDNTKETLQADEAFFAKSKASCQGKAGMWAERIRLRTEELNGMAQAISILSSESAKATFHNATTTFLQTASAKDTALGDVYERMKKLASHYKSLNLAKIAVAIKTGGHFDKIIAMIDKMISLLRNEEFEDIYHRDRCEERVNANNNGIDDLNSEMTKTNGALDRMANKETEMKTNVKKIADEIETTKASIEELRQLRNTDEEDFRQALKDDATAVELLGQAIQVLTKFYTDNHSPALFQKSVAPEYSGDLEKPPEIFETGAYGGRKEETGSVVAILSMLKDDLQKEMQGSRTDDATSQKSYEADSSALEKTLEAQQRQKAELDSDLADLSSKIEGYREFLQQKTGDLDAEESVKQSLVTDCAWVEANFKAREDKRKLEKDGLVEAKNYLAGLDAGESVLPPLNA